MYAEVAVDAPTPEKTYTYLIPQHLHLALGQAVWVPLGRESRPVQGLVFGFSDVPPPVPEVKPVLAAIESQPLLGQVALDLASWLSGYYLASLFESAALLMPPDFRQKVESSVRLVDPEGARALLPDSQLVALLQERDGAVDQSVLRKAVGSALERQLETLLRANAIVRLSRFQRPKAGPKFQRIVSLTDEGRKVDLNDPAWIRRPKQREAIGLLRDRAGPIPLLVLRAELETSQVSVSALARDNLVTLEEERVIRDPLADRSIQIAFAPELTQQQGAAWEQLSPALDHCGEGPRESENVFLLFGVTGSGKTELYLRALERCIARGKQALVLVPEIALEPQTVARFAGRFPGRVAVLHSGLSAGEAYDEWWRIKEGEFDVVIGPRSALFAPVPDLGLIVIDEEHEQTYKQQDPAPRYDARRVAHELARRTGAVLLLGSATPDLESYQAAQEGRYHLLTLSERVSQRADLPPYRTFSVHNRGLPDIEVVDLRDELKAGNHSIFSRSLQSALAQTLRSQQQAILFLNRRGAATFVQCRDCGAVLRCSRCETPLTYHSAQERLICHQCNAQRSVPRRCPACDSIRIKFLGAGTERVEQELLTLFPAARALRWDRDSTRTRRSHEELLARFTAHEADVLVGTQMVAKGLDLPLVTLVGVVNADVNLYLPDFRAAERTFQLLTQVAGRAGRGRLPGSVIIQTYTPEHYAIQTAARQDYESFFAQEMPFRRDHGYPPVQPLIRLLYAETQQERTQREATRYARALEAERARAGMAGVTVQGPVPAFFRRVRGRYRWQVMLKGPEGRELLGRVPLPRGWVADVDPVHVL